MMVYGGFFFSDGGFFFSDSLGVYDGLRWDLSPWKNEISPILPLGLTKLRYLKAEVFRMG
jgi:hypothetical protein